MKKLSLLLFLLLSIIKVSACKCVYETLAHNYQNSEFVGIIKILKVYDENTEQRSWKINQQKMKNRGLKIWKKPLPI
ncbi:hypothetical protein [Chryseobacterium cucumeris]|uniref:hypothetical protein n=1 Tax=Chryseobacterium cucumeris TaxID=1813611 RepID=UPI003D972BD1